MEGVVIGMRERDISHGYPSRVSDAYTLRFNNERVVGRAGLFKYHLGPTKTIDNAGILNRNQRERNIYAIFRRATDLQQ